MIEGNIIEVKSTLKQEKLKEEHCFWTIINQKVTVNFIVLR